MCKGDHARLGDPSGVFTCCLLRTMPRGRALMTSQGPLKDSEVRPIDGSIWGYSLPSQLCLRREAVSGVDVCSFFRVSKVFMILPPKRPKIMTVDTGKGGDLLPLFPVP